MKRKIAIWGAGNQGREAYYRLIGKYEIAGFYDSDIQKMGREVVDGKQVLEYHEREFFIVVACGQWMEVSCKLQSRGLELLEDFLPYHMLEMKRLRLNDFIDCFSVISIKSYLEAVKGSKQIALIYGNCQTEIIANMLEYNKEFHSRYALLRVPQIHLFRDEEQIKQIFYQNELMKMVDLFIYQNVKENNRFHPLLGVKRILDQMSDRCRKLCIHNIYFDGYFVQYDANEERYFANMDQKDFPYTDGIVHKLIEEGKTADEIIEIINDTSMMSKEEVLEKCEKSIDNLRQREKYVDVPIVDYIEMHYKEEQLFYTYNHPKNIVIYEYVKRILTELGIEDVDEFTRDELNMAFGTLRINNFPVFPCVVNALELEKYEMKTRISHVSTEFISMNEYVREYIARCYGIK